MTLISREDQLDCPFYDVFFLWWFFILRSTKRLLLNSTGINSYTTTWQCRRKYSWLNPYQLSWLYYKSTCVTTEQITISYRPFTVAIVKPKYQPKQTRFVYCYKKADFDGLRHTLRTTPFECGLGNDDINVDWQCWYDLFITTVEQHVPKIDQKRQ